MRILSIILMSVFVVGARAESRTGLDLDVIEAYILETGYELEKAFAVAEKRGIKSWPHKVRQSIYVKLWDNRTPFPEDPGDLSNFTRNFGINVNYSGSIIRSFVINLNGELFYLAIYLVYGGEYGNEKSFLEYYILSESGELLRSGTRRAD